MVDPSTIDPPAILLTTFDTDDTRLDFDICSDTPVAATLAKLREGPHNC